MRRHQPGALCTLPQAWAAGGRSGWSTVHRSPERPPPPRPPAGCPAPGPRAVRSTGPALLADGRDARGSAATVPRTLSPASPPPPGSRRDRPRVPSTSCDGSAAASWGVSSRSRPPHGSGLRGARSGQGGRSDMGAGPRGSARAPGLRRLFLPTTCHLRHLGPSDS